MTIYEKLKILHVLSVKTTLVCLVQKMRGHEKKDERFN